MPTTRPRNAAATRAAILASARAAFARSGYDGAGVREIAAGAGVTAILINRYFGSKERLFAEVIAEAMTTPTILAGEVLGSADPAAAMASALVDITAPGATPLDGFRIMLYSASSERAAEIGRVQLQDHYHRTLTAELPGPDAPQRAALVLALVAGVQIMRQMIALAALAEVDPAELKRLLTPVFRHLLGGVKG